MCIGVLKRSSTSDQTPCILFFLQARIPFKVYKQSEFHMVPSHLAKPQKYVNGTMMKTMLQ